LKKNDESTNEMSYSSLFLSPSFSLPVLQKKKKENANVKLHVQISFYLIIENVLLESQLFRGGAEHIHLEKERRRIHIS